MPNAIPRLFLLLFLLSLVPAMPGQAADRKATPDVGIAPPQPMDFNLRIRREGKTEIPLRIYGKANEPLKYLIRVAPEHGHLSEPRATDREVSVVIYEPPADLSITTDKFSYAVQSFAGVSAAVQITLTIVDQPPQLTIPDSIDFGTIRSGATNYRLLEIKNSGGLFATGEVIVEAPWKIEGKSGYRLGADETAIFKIFFNPETGDKYEAVARYTSDRTHSTTLRGVAEAALDPGPTPWTLQQILNDTTRTGSFELTSQLDEPRVLHLKTEARLKIPAQISLPARGKVNVTVEAAAEDVHAWDAEIRLESDDFSIAIPVRVPALTAIVRPTGPSVNFGRLAMGKKASTQFELENIGGAPAIVSWKIGAPFQATDDSTTLQPGERKSFPLEIETKTAGHFRTWLDFTSGRQTFELPVQAEVVASQTAPSAAPRPAPGQNDNPATTEANPADSLPATPTNLLAELSPAIPSDWYGDPKPPAGVRVHDVKTTSAIIEWPASLSPTTHFRVEMIQFRIAPNGKLKATWLQPTGIPIEPRGQNYAAILTGLQPSQPWTVRIVPLEPNGEAGPRLFAVDFYTPAKPPFFARLHWLASLRTLFVILGGLLIWHGWRRWGQR